MSNLISDYICTHHTDAERWNMKMRCPICSKVKFSEFQSALVQWGIVDPCAVNDPEGYDNCDTTMRIINAYNSLYHDPR